MTRTRKQNIETLAKWLGYPGVEWLLNDVVSEIGFALPYPFRIDREVVAGQWTQQRFRLHQGPRCLAEAYLDDHEDVDNRKALFLKILLGLIQDLAQKCREE